MTATLDATNRLEVPEIAAYTVGGGIVAYAVRAPGESLWRGFASDGGPGRHTIGLYTMPGTAAESARAMIDPRPAA